HSRGGAARRPGPEAAVHRRGDVEQEQHRELALVDVCLDEGPAEARRHVPVDRARIIAVRVLAHLVELDAGAAEHRRITAREHVAHQPPTVHLDSMHLAQDLGELGLCSAGDTLVQGTGTVSSTRCTRSSTRTPSASASYVVAMRWRSTFAAIALTSCGVTKPRP